MCSKNSPHTSSLNRYLLCWLLQEYITQVNIWSQTQSLNGAALPLSLGCRGRSGVLLMWNFTTALCCWSSCAAGEQMTTMEVGRQSFLCRGPSTIWPLAGNSPADPSAYLKSGCDEREAGIEPFGLDDNESRADEWISGSIQKTPCDGNSSSHNLHISAWGAVPMRLWLQIHWNHYVTMPKRGCMKHPLVTCTFHDVPLIIFTCPSVQEVRAHENNPAAGKDTVTK